MRKDFSTHIAELRASRLNRQRAMEEDDALAKESPKLYGNRFIIKPCIMQDLAPGLEIHDKSNNRYFIFYGLLDARALARALIEVFGSEVYIAALVDLYRDTGEHYTLERLGLMPSAPATTERKEDDKS